MKVQLVIGVLALSSPAFAQTPRIDWSKPVVGVDAPSKVTPEDIELPVQVLTLEQVKAERVTQPLATPLPPPCEPAPTANAPAAKPAGPPPCPAAR